MMNLPGWVRTAAVLRQIRHTHPKVSRPFQRPGRDGFGIRPVFRTVVPPEPSRDRRDGQRGQNSDDGGRDRQLNEREGGRMGRQWGTTLHDRDHLRSREILENIERSLW